MITRARIRQLPVSRLIRPSPKTPQPQLRPWRQQRPFHYDPHANIYKPPFRSRLKDMAIGAGIVVGAVGGYVSLKLYGLYGARDQLTDELKVELENLRSYNQDTAAGFAEARAQGEHHRLRQLTFELAHHVHSDDKKGHLPHYIAEVGPLQGLPYDDPMSGQELVPSEDTLVFLQKDPVDDLILGCHVSVNLDAEEVYRGMADPAPEPGADKLGELLRRVTDQVQMWRRQGRLLESDRGEVELEVILLLRDKVWVFDYAGGHYDAVEGPSSILGDPDAMMEVERILENLEGKKKKNKKPGEGM
ncbi:hypothetical protein JX266_003939 [Neoarthrinium moseri]|nr:hypothetical protein JX266_003939 [Neoarthrinium moseri]